MDSTKLRQEGPGPLVVVTDPVAEKLDELADMAEVWKRHRSKSHTPAVTRIALLMLMGEIYTLTRIPGNATPIENKVIGSDVKQGKGDVVMNKPCRFADEGSGD